MQAPSESPSRALILIVEDEAIIAADLENKLRRLGYATCSNTAFGEEVLELARKHQPDLILMDIRLAGAMDGVETAASVRRELDLPVIFLTAFCDQEYLQRAKLTEPFGYLLKPFEELGLESHIQMALYKHQTEKRLRHAHEHLVGILESLSDGFIAIDGAWKYTYVNNAAERLLGKPRRDLLGRDLREVFPGGTFLPQFAESMHTKTAKAFEGYSSTLGLWLEVRIDPSPDGLSVYFRDISKHKRAEEERSVLQSQFLQSQKMESIGRLAGGVAHDFNNMLGVIIGNADSALYLSPSEEELKECLDQIKKAAERSAKLTRQLLTFARKQTVNPKILDLNAIVNTMTSMLSRLIGEDIHLGWEPSATLWSVKLDPTQVDQVLANLSVNARDAIGGIGTIIIRTQNVSLDADFCHMHRDVQPGDFVLLSVSDTGKGIPQDILPQIFEPFFTTKGVGQGTGLGLATVFGIVKQNGGFIDVHSRLGEGTTFNLYFPRAEAPIDASDEPELRHRFAQGSETLLLVEDELALLDSTKTNLERLGYKVIAVSSPLDAIQLVQTASFEIHLLISDVVMPKMNGRELASQLQALRPVLKVLFISGYPSDIISTRGDLGEEVQFLQKPFSMTDLAHRIRHVLDQRGSTS